MKKDKPENPNDHKRKTPSTKGKEHIDSEFTSYNTKNNESSSPQKVREKRESAAEQKRKEESD